MFDGALKDVGRSGSIACSKFNSTWIVQNGLSPDARMVPTLLRSFDIRLGIDSCT